MADKITQQLTEALAKAAAHPTGLPLYAGKAEPGLFPNTAAAKPAAQKCLAQGLIRVIGSETRGRTPRELYALTDAGWDFLLEQVNPKQVLEDFVRVLEARQGEVGELLQTARRMAESLQGLREAVHRVLPAVTSARLTPPMTDGTQPPALGTYPPTVASEGHRNGRWPPSASAGRLTGTPEALADEPRAVAVAVLEPEPSGGPTEERRPDWAGRILARLADWSGAAGEDCPLPELYRSIATEGSEPTIGEFHDALRRLVADGAIGLHPWTGPLYALPEPAYALLVGHGIAYYASLKLNTPC